MRLLSARCIIRCRLKLERRRCNYANTKSFVSVSAEEKKEGWKKRSEKSNDL